MGRLTSREVREAFLEQVIMELGADGQTGINQTKKGEGRLQKETTAHGKAWRGLEQVERMRSGRSMSCGSSEAGLAESQII